MGTFRSDLPLGTSDPDVFVEGNVPNLDEAMNSQKMVWANRFGIESLTYKGVINKFDNQLSTQTNQFSEFLNSSSDEFQQFLDSSGYSGAEIQYAPGIVLSSHNQGFTRCEADGSACLFYTPNADTPLPYTTTGNWSAESSLFSAQNGDTPLRQELATPALGGGELVGFKQLGALSVTRGITNKLYDFPSVSDFGVKGDGSTEDAAWMKAIDSGHKTLYVPWGQTGVYKFGTLDFKGLSLFSDCLPTLDGIPQYVGNLRGVIYAGNKVSEKISASPPELEFSGAFIVNYAEGGHYVITKNSSRAEYVATRVRASPAADVGPWELQRIQSVFSLWDTFACQTVQPGGITSAAYSGSGWTDFALTPAVLGMESGTTNGAENARIIGKRTSTNGDSVTLHADTDESGRFNLCFLKSATMSRSVKIEYSGKEETISLEHFGATSPGLLILSFQANAIGSVQVTITQLDTGTSSRYLTLLAVNADRPEKIRPEIRYDAWTFFVMPSYRSYVVNTGAHEYAIYDLDLSRFVGSYHGSEEAIDTPKWIVDGAEAELTLNVPKAAKRGILLQQKTKIGGKLTSISDYSFFDGAAKFLCNLSGEMRTRTTYLGMELAQKNNTTFDKQCFDRLIFPIAIDVSQAGRYPLGNTEMVVWANDTTGARVSTWITSFTGYPSLNGGDSIEAADGNTTYSKWRSGLNQDVPQIFKGASFQMIKKYH